jgi:tight adherence protein C
MGRLFEIIVDALTFAIAVTISVALFRAVEAFLIVRRRLGEQGLATGGGAASVLKDQSLNNRFLQWVQTSAELGDPKKSQELKRALIAAGFEGGAAPVWYVIARFGLAIGLPVLFMVMTRFAPKPIVGLPLVFGAVVLCAIGLIGPRAYIDNRAGARRTQLEEQFPDALDLMVVCVEAGLGIEAAFIRVGQEVMESHPRIFEEFHRVSTELAVGRSRSDALRALADRVEVDSVKSFVALLIQTDALGASIAQTLRTFSSEMRLHRLLTAEEKAMRIPVLITIPLVACILPVIIAALLLPPSLDVARNLGPALSGHH